MRFWEHTILDAFALHTVGEDSSQTGRWKGAPTNLSKWWREVLDIFDNKLNICNFSLGLSDIYSQNEFRWWYFFSLAFAVSVSFQYTLHTLVLEHLMDFLECCCVIIFLKLVWEHSRWRSWSSLVKKAIDDFGSTYSSSVNIPTWLSLYVCANVLK